MSSLPLISGFLQGSIAKTEVVHVTDACGHSAYLYLEEYNEAVEKLKKRIDADCAGCCSCRILKSALKTLEEAPHGYALIDGNSKPQFLPKQEFLKEYEEFTAKFASPKAE